MNVMKNFFSKMGSSSSAGATGQQSVMINSSKTTNSTSAATGNPLNQSNQSNGAGNNSNGPNSLGGGNSGAGNTGSNPALGNNQSNGSANGGHGLNALDNESCGIRDVWASNMDDEFRIIRTIVADYPYVAMDTEFPGVVARPVGEFKSTCDYQYHLLKVNVDLLKIIQLGLTFMDSCGKPRPGISTWQFNFRFNLNDDMYAQDSIELLQNSGIQFKKHKEEGIDVFEFAELLMTSGVVLNDNVKYLSFHSGYDFGYLLKILTWTDLPSDEAEFFDLLRIYFPVIYDVKYLMKSCKDLKGGLQEVSHPFPLFSLNVTNIHHFSLVSQVADQLELHRIGPQHQAGSDSLLTGAAFFKMREMFFEDNIDDVKYCGHLYGLGTSFVNNGGSNNTNNNNAAVITNLLASAASNASASSSESNESKKSEEVVKE